MPTLVYGRSLLTGRLDVPEIPDGGLIIDGTVITEVGSALDLRQRHAPAAELGGHDRIVVPGLVSAHQHGGGVSSVQLGCPDQPFERWMIKMLGVPPLDSYLDTLYHAARLIENGITTTIHSHYTRDIRRYDDEVDDHLRAWSLSGMRVAFAPCFLDNNQFVYESNAAFLRSLPAGVAAQATRLLDLGPDISGYLDLVTALRKRFDGSDSARVLLGPVAPQWCTTTALERMAAEGEPSGGVHAHLLESPAQRHHLDEWLEGSVVQWLDRLGFLGPAASFAHGVWLRPAEMELLAARSTTVVHNPGSNLRLGNGIAPVQAMREAGIPVALGTDEQTLSDNNDLIAEARLAGLLAGLTGTALMPAELLNMATGRGAAAAGFGELTGELAAGRRADVVLIDAERMTEPAVRADLPMADMLIARGLGSDVRTVLIGGKMVFHEGTHSWVDRDAVVAELREVARRQEADPRRREMREVAEQIARAFDGYPTRVFDPLTGRPARRLIPQSGSRLPDLA
jgi:5-methylthioadenosine/S-adenosylhomocysteine deaminase